MKVLFLHGWTSTPGVRKPTFLVSQGVEVLNPALPDDDFDESVRIAQAEYDQHNPDVVVGSSRGGAVAVNIDSDDTPLVLLRSGGGRAGQARASRRAGPSGRAAREDRALPGLDGAERLREPIHRIDGGRRAPHRAEGRGVPVSRDDQRTPRPVTASTT